MEESKSIAAFVETLPGDGAPTKKFQDWAKSQGADGTLGWTFIYEHGSAAGDQPTYGVYMKPDSELYGTVYHVGDYLPNGSRLILTLEDNAQVLEEDVMQKAEEEGWLQTNPETGEVEIVIGD